MTNLFQISEYCERLDASWLAEPANFFTNAAFLLAAYAAYRQARTLRLLADPAVRWLLFWLTTIGFGSALFHSLASPLTKLCDVLPIGMFVVSFFGLWLRQIVGLTKKQVACAYLVLTVVSALALVLCRNPLFGGSQGYFGVLLLMPALGIDQNRRFGGKPRLLYASAAFALALVLRTVDKPLCPWFPLGTHWAWHLLNAFVCWSAMTAMLEAKFAKSARS